MKLSRLYSNRPSVFAPIDFASGLNVVLAEIRLPENKKKDTHNLGKTTLGRLIDFCLLSREPKMFATRPDIFGEFVFYLELELLTGGYVTVRRSVAEASKVSFKKHSSPHQDFTIVGDSAWDHLNVAFSRARDLLDGILDLTALKPWSYRKGLGYLVRSQDDFGDVFHLGKFPGKHSEWKPYLAHILGFDADLLEKRYVTEEKLTKRQADEKTIQNELGGSVEDLSKIEGMLLLKEKEAAKKQSQVDAFDFRTHDKAKTKALVDEVDEQIAGLNAERYSRTQALKKIEASLKEDEILFNPNEAQKLFAEVGVLFPGQVKADFVELIAFNKAITEERRAYLQEELEQTEDRLRELNSDLNELGKKRSRALAFLTETDVFNKYKQISDELVTLRADIATLERQKSHLRKLQELRAEIRGLSEAKAHLQTQIEENVEAQNTNKESLFSTIRVFFADIIDEVIDRKALLSVSPNQEGHLEFKAEILDESGNATSADAGFTYRKLLCIAFDMAVLRAHLGEKFPRFVYHDGVFESLDVRKKENLLAVIREYCQLGLQHVITLIDSDLPPRLPKDPPVFDASEVIVRLHDEGPQGRLFRMNSW